MIKQEEILQQEIYKYFHNNYCLKNHVPKCSIFAVPNDTQNVRELLRKKATGLVSGVSDLIVLMPNKCIFVEVKTEKGKQSDKQKEFQATVENLGFDYFVVRNLDEFKQKIKNKI